MLLKMSSVANFKTPVSCDCGLQFTGYRSLPAKLPSLDSLAECVVVYGA